MRRISFLIRHRRVIFSVLCALCILGVASFDATIARSFASLPKVTRLSIPARGQKTTSPLQTTHDETKMTRVSGFVATGTNSGDEALRSSITTSDVNVTESLKALPQMVEQWVGAQPEGGVETTMRVVSNTRVVRTIDGDTLVILWQGKEESVRLIGVDTPESVDPRTTVQCYGKEAADALRDKANGRQATFMIDLSQGEHDKYHRLLGYIILDDGTLINEWLIHEGYGFEYTYNLPYKYQREFRNAEKDAQSSSRGLWAPDTCNGQRALDGVSNWQPVRSDDRDCNSFTTQREAQNFFEANGGSPTSDPHNLDRDHDGTACELLP